MAPSKQDCVFSYPMPVVVVGADVEGRANFMTASWFTRLSAAPDTIGVSMERSGWTAEGIRHHGEFSVSLPSVDQVELVDYLGLVSGRDTEKAARVEVVRGELRHAPMLEACPLRMECQLTQVVDFRNDWFFVAEVARVYADDFILARAGLDLTRIRPLVLDVPGSKYRLVGESAGQAWAVGKGLLGDDDATAG